MKQLVTLHPGGKQKEMRADVKLIFYFCSSQDPVQWPTSDVNTDGQLVRI